MDAIILCGQTTKRLKERRPAIFAVERLLTVGLDVRTPPLRRGTDYAAMLREHWDDPRILINLEQDLAPSPEAIHDLIDCPYPLCTIPYWLAPSSTGLRDVVFSLKNISDDWLWTTWGTAGCVKIAPEYRNPEMPPNLVHWKRVEYELRRLYPGPWHVHWPAIVHYHGFWEETIERGPTFQGPPTSDPAVGVPGPAGARDRSEAAVALR